MDVQPAYQEEQRRLDETLREIESQLAQFGPRYHGDDFVEQVLDAKREVQRQRLEQLGKEPYFGRIDFEEEGHDRVVPFYVGKRGMSYQQNGEPCVIDWRAPLASMFYSFNGGDDGAASFDAPDGTVHGTIHRKRNVAIREQMLQRVVDSYVRGEEHLGFGDEFLLYRLGERKDHRLRDIVSTIQAEQDRIIRAPHNTAMIIQGAAGSGKTTVALHRLAYLLYQYQDRIRTDRTMIFAPNKMFLDYISSVLPELGVGDVKQTTFTEWAMELIRQDVQLTADVDAISQWFAVPGRPRVDERTPGRYKGSLQFKQFIDDRIRVFESRLVVEQQFEAWEGELLSKDTIREWFEVEYRHYPLHLRRERLVARIKRWLEMRLDGINDPQARKERSKLGKQRLRAYLAKLPEVDVISFYAQLFGISRKKGKAAGTTPAVSEGLPPEVVAHTAPYLRRGCIEPDDLAPLVWIHQRFHGPPKRLFDHIVIDEAQDISPFQLALLRSMMREPSLTVLGDLAQGIHDYRGVLRWEELRSVLEDESVSYHELRQSYRSTLEIIEFANRVLPHTHTGLPAAQPVFRSGEPVTTLQVADGDERLKHAVDFIETSQQQGMQTIAIIGRTEETCAALHRELGELGVQTHLLSNAEDKYRGGVSVVPVYWAKGLEFDAVLLVDVDAERYPVSPHDAKLLYVGCTRALHRLTLLYMGEPSPMIIT